MLRSQTLLPHPYAQVRAAAHLDAATIQAVQSIADRGRSKGSLLRADVQTFPLIVDAFNVLATLLNAANVRSVGIADIQAMAYGVSEVNVLGKPLSSCEAGLIGASSHHLLIGCDRSARRETRQP